MTLAPPKRWNTLLNSLFLAGITVFLFSIANNHVQLITHEYPLDYNEGGMLVTTATMLEGGSSYSLESQPSRMSMYPVFYNVLVVPLARVFGNSFELHRAVTGFFILACCALVFYLCRKNTCRRVESILAASLLYAGLLYYSTPVSSVNSLGLFLFLAAITFPWVRGFSTSSLAFSMALGILAFFTKQYFVACLGYIALYLFLAESKARAIVFGCACVAALIAALTLVCMVSPYYLENTYFAVQSSAKLAASNEHLLQQLKEYSVIYLPLLLALAASPFLRIRDGVAEVSRPSLKDTLMFNFSDWKAPLLQHKPDYIWFCFACSMIIFVLVLGKNRGNHLTYLFQLVSPFLLIAIYTHISKTPRWPWLFKLLTLAALYTNYAMLPADFSVKDDNWRKLRMQIDRHDDIYASTLVLRDMIAKGGPIYLSGGTRYYPWADDKPAIFIKSDPERRVSALWERHVTLVQDKLRGRQFDLLVIDGWMPLPRSEKEDAADTKALLEEHYELVERFNLPLAKRPGGGNYRIQLWKPLPPGS